jgi:hypothetical protein
MQPLSLESFQDDRVTEEILPLLSRSSQSDGEREQKNVDSITIAKQLCLLSAL